MTHTLTPADVMSLRMSVTSSLRSLGGGVNLGAPYILYLPADETFCLHAYGSPQAKSADLGVLGACLIAERSEPGFIRRILDPSVDCELALRDAEANRRAQDAARARYIQTQADKEAAEEARWAARRTAAIDVTKVDLDI